MKKIIGILLLAFSLTGVAEARDITNFRCERNLITLGAHKFEVEKKCGQPNSIEDLGCTDREFKVIEWTYGPTNHMYFILVFERNVLVEITTVRE